MKPTVEICACSLEDCRKAQKGGAGRVELNGGICAGGLTPTTALLKSVKKEVEIPIVCMVRPRGSGFCYNEDEKALMFEEAKDLLEAGADGLAFGFLNEDSTVDVPNTKKMADLIHHYGREAVFHRAFDDTPDYDAAAKALIECGIDRVLTSCEAAEAPDAPESLAHLQKTYGDQLQIQPGGGVRSHNVEKLIRQTGVHNVHSSARAWGIDKTGVRYPVRDENLAATRYEICSLEEIMALVEAANRA